MSLQTAERVSHTDHSDNVMLQRHLIAYHSAVDLVKGHTFEIGSGEGYGIELLAPKTDKYTAIDKYPTPLAVENTNEKVEFKQMTIPPIEFADNSFDAAICFQVIEHIKDDHAFVKEIERVLKPGASIIFTTPNIKTTLTRNPWHIREYTVKGLHDLLSKYFSKVEVKGVFGNEKIMEYYERNKASVKKITRWDILNLQYNLPRFMLQIPYDLMNRMNRKKLLTGNDDLVKSIKHTDYSVKPANDECFDLFAIATK